MGNTSPEQDEERARCQAEIRAILLSEEPLSWTELRRRYPSVTPDGDFTDGEKAVRNRKFFKWVSRAKDDLKAAKSAAGAALRRDAGATTAYAARQLEKLARDHPTPLPTVVNAMGDMTLLPPVRKKSVDFIAAIPELWEDAELVRQYGFKVKEDGERAVRIPNVALNSISTRLRIMETALRVMQDAFDLAMMQEFYTEIVAIIVEEIGETNAVVQHRIIERLRKLEERQTLGSAARSQAGR